MFTYVIRFVRRLAAVMVALLLVHLNARAAWDAVPLFKMKDGYYCKSIDPERISGLLECRLVNMASYPYDDLRVVILTHVYSACFYGMLIAIFLIVGEIFKKRNPEKERNVLSCLAICIGMLSIAVSTAVVQFNLQLPALLRLN